MDIDKVISQLKESAKANDKQAEETESKHLELRAYHKGQADAFRSSALLLAKLTLEDTLENL
ncbi:hypothetical protein ACTFR8_23400 [Bacillus cereus group sp. MYBK15-3]|uniref:hypothetical protein n=1 Tax=Bacillus cereus group TaxID=86661 RepID=UPI001C8C3BC2|nr:hypothetical protein [Bacillus cereus]MBX9158546.1 hypothetical protein [Bacillus cereus]